MSPENGMSRRAALVKLGVFLNGIVGIFLAVPIVRYLFSPVTPLKRLNTDPAFSARLEQFHWPDDAPPIEIRGSMTGTEKPATSRVGFVGLMMKLSRSLPSTAHTWDARCAGFHNQVCSCVPVTAALIIRTVRAPLDLPSAACSSTATKLRTENFSSKLARCRPPVSPLQIRREVGRHAPDPKTR